MNQTLKSDIVKYLNEVSALKSCNIKIKNRALDLEDVNQATMCLWLIKTNEESDFKSHFQEKIDSDCTSTMRFLMEADIKITDIEQLDLALNKILRLNWENIEFEYKRG